MNHEDILNQILANSCPREVIGSYRVFEYDLHCAVIRIEAALLAGPDDNDNFKYEIRSVVLKNDSGSEETDELPVYRNPDSNFIFRERDSGSQKQPLPLPWEKLDADPNGIGPVCKYCDRLIDSPTDHKEYCLALAGETPVPSNPFETDLSPEPPKTVSVPAIRVATSNTTNLKENKTMYYGNSISTFIDSLRDKIGSAEEARDDLQQATAEIEDKVSELESFIDDMETLINNLDELPEIEVSISVDVSFDSSN